jgi:cupin 2 domain-containing protein
MNIFADHGVTYSSPLPAEVFETLAQSAHVRIERIVSEGHTSPAHGWYDQDQSEWVLLLQGAARLEFEDSTLALSPGDYVNIPAHRKHRVVWTTPDQRTIWLAVFYG